MNVGFMHSDDFNEPLALNKLQISKLIQITEPFLMLDSADKIFPGKSAVGHKEIIGEEIYFDCHLKSQEVYPGVLLVETMLQTLLLPIYTSRCHHKQLAYVSDIQTKLLRKAIPGMALVINAELTSEKRGIRKGICSIANGEVKICHGSFTLVSPHELPKVLI